MCIATTVSRSLTLVFMVRTSSSSTKCKKKSRRAVGLREEKENESKNPEALNFAFELRWTVVEQHSFDLQCSKRWTERDSEKQLSRTAEEKHRHAMRTYAYMRLPPSPRMSLMKIFFTCHDNRMYTTVRCAKLWPLFFNLYTFVNPRIA